jgi:predicted SnoaL-like aldol condensation-catalyzing enzyme
MAKQDPGKGIHFKGDRTTIITTATTTMALHCHQEWPSDISSERAGIDIFRLDDNSKIVEHWDVLQRIPEKSANNNIKCSDSNWMVVVVVGIT